MDRSSLPPLSRVAICGGTHGNEMSGVYMVRHMQQQQQKKKKKTDEAGTVSVTAVLSNPEAVDACRRYKDTDLNRCFTNALLSAPVSDTSPYELRRAKELNAQFGPKESPEAVDLICDLHNTTANMGVCVLFHISDWVALHIYKYLQEKMKTPVRGIQIDGPFAETYSLDSLGKHGLSIEVGPQPNGVVRADIYNLMKEAVDLMIEWLEAFNSGRTFEGGEVEVYSTVTRVDFPRDPATNEIAAAVHPDLQDNDFKLLRPGDATFLMFSGETLKYEGEELYPFFVNECAYYEKKTAFILAKKVASAFPSLSVKKE